jgi:hypothetical protein
MPRTLLQPIVRVLWILPLLWIFSSSARAATIEVPHSTLARLLTDETFPDHRRYIAGKPGDACNWGYVRDPRITTVPAGLEFRGRVRGAFKLLGFCTTLGRELPVRAVATPVFSRGVLSFRATDLHIEGQSGGRVLRFLLERILDRLRLDLRGKLAALASGARGPNGIGFKLTDLDVKSVKLLADRVRLDVDFALEVQ